MLDEYRLVENDVSLELRGNIAQGQNGFLDAVYNSDGIRVSALLLDRHIHGFLAVHADNVVLHGGTIGCFANVRKKYGFLPLRLYWDIVEVSRIADLRVCVNIVIHRTDSNVAGRQN